MKQPNKITVVYATDYGYLRYTIVSAFSLLKNVTDGNEIELVILVPSDMPITADEMVKKALSEFNNFSVRLIRMGNEFDHVNLTIAHITSPTYYRLLLPNMLPDTDKCIYIDGDTIVNGDIAQLWKEAIGDNLVAGVKAFDFYKNDINVRKTLEYVDNEIFVYVNAGVLVFNLKEMRAANSSEAFMKLLPNQYPCQDQDIINIGCKGRIKTISMCYNTMTKYAMAPLAQIGKWVTEEEYETSKTNPVIIHFADRVKPWSDLSVPWAEKWFEYCLSPSVWPLFYDLEIEKIRDIIKGTTTSSYKKKHRNIFSYIKQVGPKYAFNRALSAIRNRK